MSFNFVLTIVLCLDLLLNIFRQCYIFFIINKIIGITPVTNHSLIIGQIVCIDQECLVFFNDNLVYRGVITIILVLVVCETSCMYW